MFINVFSCIEGEVLAKPEDRTQTARYYTGRPDQQFDW